ncbi:hypothetical protein Pmani_012046 [Petrolisthes manimaculis]|uniref:BTB domain-containing protein n=1 Tax=Petrolisthes manimaculis TaxID=1843537 RepID=A0AAE1PZZ0_9EUCA|nr:hypothetical protein Pmani_012046 [Petrolisthes manimaculis]
MVTEGKMTTPLIVEDRSDVLHQRLGQLNQLRKSRHFCDVVLQVGSSEIPAHRAVLSCASPYFFELFTSEHARKTPQEGKLLYKLCGGFEKESVDLLVNYAYTGHLEVPDTLVRNVFIVAKRLKMEGVSSACGEHLVSHLNPDSCLAVRATPGIASDKVLVERVDRFIQQLDDLVPATREFGRVQVSVIHRTQEEAGITGRALCNLVLEWIQRQMMDQELNLDVIKDKKHMLYLNMDNSLHDCSDIKSGDLNDSDLVQDYKKMSRKLSQTNIKVRRKSTTPQPSKPRLMLFSRSISDKDDSDTDTDWKLIAHSQVSESSWLAVVTLCGTVAVLSVQQKFGGWGNNGTQKNSSSVVVGACVGGMGVRGGSCSPTSLPSPISSRPGSVEKIDSYTLVPHMSSPKCATGTGNLGGRLLVCGGYDRGECLRTVETYDPLTNAWTSCPTMRQGRGRFDLTVLGGRAYAVGGCDGVRELASVEVLDMSGQRWESVAPLPLARSNTGVCSLDDSVFCIGGWNGQYGIKQCDMYSPNANAWSTIAPLHVGRYQAGVASLEGLVYAVGGCDSWNCLNSVEVYDPKEDQWRFTTPMTTPRRGCGAEVFKGKLYVIGGSDGTQSLCTTEVYDVKTKTWLPGPSMTTCRANVGVAVVNGNLYAVGGFSGKNFLNSIEYLDPNTNEWTNFTPKPDQHPSLHTFVDQLNETHKNNNEGMSSSSSSSNSSNSSDTSDGENEHQHQPRPMVNGVSHGGSDGVSDGVSDGTSDEGGAATARERETAKVVNGVRTSNGHKEEFGGLSNGIHVHPTSPQHPTPCQ